MIIKRKRRSPHWVLMAWYVTTYVLELAHSRCLVCMRSHCMPSLPPQTCFSKCGVNLAVGLFPRVHCEGLLFLGLAVGSRHHTPARLQWPRLQTAVWVTPPELCSLVALLYSFFFFFNGSLWCLHCWLSFVGIRSKPLILVNTSVATPVASSSTLTVGTSLLSLLTPLAFLTLLSLC